MYDNDKCTLFGWKVWISSNNTFSVYIVMLVFNFLDPLICLGYVAIILLFVSKAILGVKILSRRVNSCLELWPILQVNSATSTLSNVSAYLNELNWSALSGSNYWLLWSWIGDMYELYLQFTTIRRLHWILQLRTVWRNVSQQFSQGFPLCEYNRFFWFIP